MKNLYLIALFIVLVGCNSVENNVKTNDSTQLTARPEKATKKETLTVDTTGLLMECKSPDRVFYAGSLQGVKAARDSTGYMCFMKCYTCPRTYKIVFVYKGGVEKRKTMSHDSLHYAFESGCDNNFVDFDCFAFVLPLVDPEKQGDEHGSSMKFPEIVKVYKRVDGDNWHFLKVSKVNSFEEYGSLEFKTIYGL